MPVSPNLGPATAANLLELKVDGIEIDPSGAVLNDVLKFNGTKFIPQAGSAPSTLLNLYQTGPNSAASRFLLDSTRQGIWIQDNAVPIGLPLLNVTDSAGTAEYLSVTAGTVFIESDAAFKLRLRNTANTSSFLEVTTGGVASYGLFNFGGVDGNEWLALDNTSPASGGTPLQVAPEIYQSGRIYDGAVSRTIAATQKVKGDGGGGGSYTATWQLDLTRDATTATALKAHWDNNVPWVEIGQLVLTQVGGGGQLGIFNVVDHGFGATFDNNYLYFESNTAATGGTPVQAAPAFRQVGRAYDGTNSQVIGARLALDATDANTVNYKTRWQLRLRRGGVTSTPISAFYDGTTVWIEAANIRSGTATMSKSSDVANGGSAVGFSYNNTVTLNNATARLFEFKNNSSDWFYLLGNGNLNLASGGIFINTINSIGTGSSSAALLQNTTAATSGVQQNSPGIALEGQGWSTTNTVTRTIGTRLMMQSISGTEPWPRLLIQSQVGNGSYTTFGHFGPWTGPSTGLQLTAGASGSAITLDGPVTGLQVITGGATRALFDSASWRCGSDNGLALGSTSVRFSAGHMRDVHVSASPGVGSGTGVIALGNASVVPSTNPSAGGVLYAEAGALKWRGSGGTVTTIANA